MKPRCDKWLIPAHAGKTALYVRVSRIPRAHPRSRGENVIVKAAAGPEVGSSPLTRGKPHQRSPHRSSRGLIPAHAGKTVLLRTSGAGDRAHPRSRGENRDLGGGDDTSHGSSPLTRGKPEVGLVRASDRGLIPAHAGKTLAAPGEPRANAAHPRSRGENPMIASRRPSVVGSSPLTRGKQLAAETSTPLSRLIPAHAGKTLPDLRFYCADRSDLGKP